MSITLDELLALVRSGEVDLWILKLPDPDEMRQRRKDPNFTGFKAQVQIHVEHKSDKEKTFELTQLINNHMQDIYLMLTQGDARLCMLPSQHWQTYQKIEDELSTYYRCNLCEEARAQMIDGFLPLLPAPATILDFQAHQKRKQEG